MSAKDKIRMVLLDVKDRYGLHNKTMPYKKVPRTRRVGKWSAVYTIDIGSLYPTKNQSEIRIVDCSALDRYGVYRQRLFPMWHEVLRKRGLRIEGGASSSLGGAYSSCVEVRVEE